MLVSVQAYTYLMHCLYNRFKFTCTAVTMFVSPHMYNRVLPLLHAVD